MSNDNQINSDDEQSQLPANQAPSNPPSGEAEANVKTVPYPRFKEVNDRTNALEAENKALKAAEQQRQADAESAEQKRLEEKEEFKTLYETAKTEKEQAAESLASLTAKAEVMEKALTAQWDAQKGLIPEMFLELVEAMPIEQRIEWMSANSEKLAEKDKGGGTPRRSMSRTITPPTQNTNGPAVPSFKF